MPSRHHHHPFHVPSATMCILIFCSFLVIGVWMERRFKSRFKQAYRASLNLTILALLVSSILCILFPLVYQIWAAFDPQLFYVYRKNNCLGHSATW